MSAISVPSVNAYTAHHEWANRPADERYTSVADLFAAARARRAQTVEYVTESHDLRVEAVGPDSLQLVDATRQPIAMAACSADSFSGTAMSARRRCRWICSSTGSCVATTSSGDFSISPAFDVVMWAHRSPSSATSHSMQSRRRSTLTRVRIAICSIVRRLANSARAVKR